MFKRIFVNAILAPICVGGFLAMLLPNGLQYGLTPIAVSIGLLGTNINWCRKHLWKHDNKSTEEITDDYMRSKTYANLDNVESPKVGNSLKRGTDLRK